MNSWQFYFLPECVSARHDAGSRKLARRRFWKLFLFTMFLFYPGVSSTILRTFVCEVSLLVCPSLGRCP